MSPQHSQPAVDESTRNVSSTAHASGSVNRMGNTEETFTFHKNNHLPMSDLGSQMQYIPVDDPCYQQTFSPAHMAALEIHEICEKADVPRGFYDDLIKVLKKHMYPKDGSVPVSIIDLPKREKFMNALKERFPTAEPEIVRVALETHFPEEEDISRPRRLRDVKDVIKFEFSDQAKDLLSALHILGDVNNLVINPGMLERFYPYQPPTDDHNLDEILDGRWYQETVKIPMHLGNGHIFWIPIIIYVDKTGTDVFQRYGLEPVIFTFGIFRRHVRNRPEAWRILGFIPDLEAKSSAVKKKATQTQATKGLSCRNYHKCLSVVLESFKRTQKQKVFDWHLRLGSYMMRCNLRFPLCFVIGDAKSQDVQCGRFGGYKTKRMSRKCCQPYQKCGDPNATCRFVDAKSMDEYSRLANAKFEEVPGKFNSKGEPLDNKGRTKKDHEKMKNSYIKLLHEMSQHCHTSAYIDIFFGANPHGIFGATPTDLMHAFLEGALKYLIRLYVDPLPPSNKADFDFWVDHVLGQFRSSMKYEYPRSNFTHGFTNLTQLTADEWAGMAQTLLLASQFADGVVPLQDRFYDDPDKLTDFFGLDKKIIDSDPIFLADIDEDDEGEDMFFDAQEELCYEPNDARTDGEETHREMERTGEKRLVTYEEAKELLERVLAFHAYYKRGSPYVWDKPIADPEHPCGPKERFLRIQIRELISMIVSRIPRDTGNGWNLQKIHELLHIPSEMTLFGSPANWDSGPCESALKTWAKKPAKTSQKWGPEIFNDQVSQRLHETACFQKALRVARRNFDFAIERKNHNLVDVHNLPQSHSIDPFDDISSESTGTSTSTYRQVRFGDRVQHMMIGNPKFAILYYRKREKVYGRWLGKRKQKRLVDIHPTVIRYFKKLIKDHPEYIPSHPGVSVSSTKKYPEPPEKDVTVIAWGYTEYFRNDVLFRAHPNYRSRGPWYDWTMVLFSDERKSGDIEDIQYETEFPRDYFPSKILAFFEMCFDGSDRMLIHPTEDLFHDIEGNPVTTRLTESWRLHYRRTRTERDPVGIDGKALLDEDRNIVKSLEVYSPKFQLVTTDAIGVQVYVLEEDPGISELKLIRKEDAKGLGLVVRLKSRDTYWPTQFLCGDYGKNFPPKDHFCKALSANNDDTQKFNDLYVDWTEEDAIMKYLDDHLVGNLLANT